MIPALTSSGLLPPGRHRSTMEEIAEVFVERAPHTERRRRIFRAFELYADMIQEIIESGSFWVNGGFCTYKADPPNDVDLAVIIDQSIPLTSKDYDRLAPLFTLQGVQVAQPAIATPRVQPMGGLIDSFAVMAGIAVQEQYWHDMWSKVKGPDGQPVLGASKGYLEVTW